VYSNNVMRDDVHFYEHTNDVRHSHVTVLIFQLNCLRAYFTLFYDLVM